MTLESQSLNLNARQILLRRLSTPQALAYTGPLGEVVIDTTMKLLRVQDGVTPGGTLVATNVNISNLQAQIDSLKSNFDPAAIDSITEVLANVNALLDRNAETQLVNSGFYANLTSSGDLVLDGHFLPKSHIAKDLGSPTRAWRDLYLSNATAYFGNTALTITNNGLTLVSGGQTLPYIGNIRFPDGSTQTTAVNQSTVANIYALLTPNIAANLTAIHADVTNAISYFGQIVEAETNDIRANLASLAKTWTAPHTGNVWSTLEYHSGARVTNKAADTEFSVNLTTRRAADQMAEYNYGTDSINVIEINKNVHASFGEVVEAFDLEFIVNSNVYINGIYANVSSLSDSGNAFVISLNEDITGYANSAPVVFNYSTGALGMPVAWFDVAKSNTGTTNFRGAVIDYHAYVEDRGTVIGTMHIANDNGKNHVTHTETSSGSTSLGSTILWGRFDGKETKVFYYQANGLSVPLSIHWVAKLFYGDDFLS